MALVWKDEYLNFILAPITILMMVTYNVNLYLRFKRNPMGTVMGVNHRARRAWVRAIMQDNDKKNILAVQTLRNSIMGSTLMATTAILLSSGVAAFLASTYTVKKPLSTSLFGLESSGYLIITYLCLLMGFLFAFLCYVQTVRYTNHVNFLVNIPIQGQFTPDYTADVLERAANFYTIGTRALYMSIPLLLWLFGPVPFFLSTVFLIPVLYWLDTAQDCAVSAGDNCSSQSETQLFSRSCSQAPFHPPICTVC
ncbi:unnamed protein product [Calypogeia fissa]